MTQSKEVAIRTFKEGVRRISKSSLLDPRTQSLLFDELKKRIRRDQKKEIREVIDLLEKSTLHEDTTFVQEALRRCYLQGRYRDHEPIRYFLKAQITSWPNETILTVLKDEKNTLESKTRTIKGISTIKFPAKKEMELPSLSNIMGLTEESGNGVLEPIPIKPSRKFKDFKEARMNEMLTKVLTLYKFLWSNTFLHSRNFKSPIASIPVSLLGKEIADCRKKNIIKKKIAYIRNTLSLVPPLETSDSEYLTNLVDDWHTNRGYVSKQILREYKKFLRKCYSIDPHFNIKLNKYAYIKANVASRTDYFES